MYWTPSGDEASRSAKMQSLIGKAQSGLIRKRFDTTAELLVGVYGALVEFLRESGLVHWGPFDASPCVRATLDDLDHGRMRQFIMEARAARRFPLDEETPAEKLLEHLNMIYEGQLSNAAVLLFGKRPQHFILSSEIRCAHFHGTEAVKPIPSYQVYEGSVFALVDEAVDFVLSKINLRVGTRENSNKAPRTYEIPPGVVSEAIVNAVAHRDYTHSSCVQVMLFADRLEILNPGLLFPPLTIDMLGTTSRSLPPNPLLASGMYLNKYIERMGTGMADMIRLCAEAGIPAPEFSADGSFAATIRRPPAAGDLIKDTAKRVAHRPTARKKNKR